MSRDALDERLTMRHLDTGITMAIREYGPAKGRPIVMLHGFPETGSTWRPVAARLADEGVRTIAPDLRGFGLSDAPRRVVDYRLDRLVADVAEVLASLPEPVDVVGHDWGGALLWIVVERHPELVRSAVVLSAPHATELRRSLLVDRDQRRRTSYVFSFQLPWFPERRFGADDGALPARMMRGTHDADEIADYRACWRRPGVMRGMLNWYRALLRRPGPARPIPVADRHVLLATGELDPLFGPRVLQASVERIIGTRHVELPGVGHSPHRQAIDETAELILQHHQCASG